MKKILLLGGSAQQVIAIETAKYLGYYTVLCDFLEDNPGQYVADKFYLISTTDKEKILEIAQAEKIDGVLAYASMFENPEIYTVGDNYNDLGMIKDFESFAVSNAVPAVKEAAKHQCDRIADMIDFLMEEK